MSRHSHTDCLPEKRGMGPVGIVAFSCGVILLYWLTLLPPYPWLIAFAVMAAGAAMVPQRRLWSRLWWWLCWCLLGLSWASWHAENRLEQRLPPELEGTRLAVSGYVCDLPQPGSFGSLRFGFCVHQWHGLSVGADAGQLPNKLRLAWYGRDGRSLPDHRLRLDVVLKRPHGNLNLAGFRYEDWLFRHGVRATGSIRSVSPDTAVPCGLECRYRLWHREMADSVTRHFGDARHVALVSSLLIGDRGGLDASHWETLKATGTIHLVAISGLHLGLVAVAVGLLGRRLVLMVPAGRVSAHHGRIAVFVLVVFCCFIYALLAGFTVPTRRALVMVVAGGWYLLMARQSSAWRPLAVALGSVLVLDPFAPLDQGFWLSFGAVAVLILVFAGRLGAPGWLNGLVIAQFAVFAGLWPILLQFNQSQPFAGLLANIVAIPWVSLLVMPTLFVGALLTVISGGALAGWAIVAFDLVLAALWGWLEWVQGLSWSTLSGSSGLLLTLVALVTVLALRFPASGFRAMAAVALLVWLASGFTEGPLRQNLAVPEPELRIFDVGQGLSVLIRSGDKVLLYDTGPEVRGVFSAVESVLVPGLTGLGISRIDHLVISHGDSDHAGGLPALFEAFEVRRVSSGEPAQVQDKAGAEVSVQPCAERQVRWAGLLLEFWQSRGDQSGNDASCVLRVTHPASGTEVLLTGDISQNVEAEMLADPFARWFRKPAGQRIVVAPHHGSKTSSSATWVAALQPDQVIYTAGYRHRYGHPHPQVTERYRLAGANALNTACSGQIVIAMTPAGPDIQETRLAASFWISGEGLVRDQCKIP